MTAHDPSTRLNAALEGRYRIERELGEGGMATVYLAQDQRHERSVALKVMKSDVAALIGADRFLQEIRVTANLHHPHVLPLFDSGEADGALFYVMPYVEGESLRARLDREGALPIVDAARIFREIVDALGAAHEQGLVHRDIKPANVLLTGQHAQVADFGVARALTEASEGDQLTTMGVAIGTPGYMAPEQAAADPHTDHRADLFAAGVLAYEMLTGRHPFVGESAQATLAALMTVSPPAITDLRPEVPPALAEAVHRCLEKDPAARWQNAAELLAALDDARIPGQETPAAVPPTRGGRRLVPAVAALAVVAAGVLYFTRGGEDLEAWARSEALPEIEDLAEVGEFEAAYRLAARAEEAIPNDPVLAELRAAITAPLTIETEPPGAVVQRREYSDSEGEWETLGTTPIMEAPVPRGASRYRIELEGYETVELLEPGGGTRRVPLQATDGPSAEGVWVEGFTATIDGTPVELDAFLIDRFEVTNRDFEAFVDAGGYERAEYWTEPFIEDGRTLPREEVLTRFVATSFYREHVIQWIQDVGRTIDYLEVRSETDAERLGFFGASWGGRMASIALALEPRFDVAVLNVAGFAPTVPQPEVHAVTYTPRVTLPVLMLSGQYDHIFPLETQARPLFEKLGTPPEDKRHVVAAGGHFVPRIDLMRESLAWFDEYLGPVR